MSMSSLGSAFGRAAAPGFPPSAERFVTWNARRSLLWLGYLAVYPTPWFDHAPTRAGVIASSIGVTAFVAIYLDSLGRRRANPQSLVPHIAAFALIGFALSPFGGVWSVFNVFASSFAGRLRPRRRMVVVLVGLQASLIGFGLLTGRSWQEWIWGVFFGSMSGLAVAGVCEIEIKNRALEAAQSEVRRLAETAERERIARDLHDLLGHTLTLVAVKSELAARLAGRDPAAACREMEEVAVAARDALGEVREAVAGMAGAALTVELDRARRMLAAARIRADIHADAVPGGAAREAVLAMALREAVTNVIRHAGARSCTIRLDAGPEGGLLLQVQDDGCGGDIREGSGLLGMRTRLTEAGGQLEVRSGGRGVSLLARLPAAA